MQSMGNNKYSILYVMILGPWLRNRNVKIGHMTTVQMAVSREDGYYYRFHTAQSTSWLFGHSTTILVLELPVIFYLEQESNIEDFIASEVFGNVSRY